MCPSAKRPIGVWVFGFLLALGAVVNFFASFDPEVAGVLPPVYLGLGLVLSVLTVFAVVSLCQSRAWARVSILGVTAALALYTLTGWAFIDRVSQKTSQAVVQKIYSDRRMSAEMFEAFKAYSVREAQKTGRDVPQDSELLDDFEAMRPQIEEMALHATKVFMFISIGLGAVFFLSVLYYFNRPNIKNYLSLPAQKAR